jgi:DNA-binding PucR family transcriptional regulator
MTVGALMDELRADVERAARRGVAPEVLARALRLGRQVIADYAETAATSAGDMPPETPTLEAMVLGGPERALALAREELGPLAAAGPRAALLRGTVEAWFAAGEAPARAAERLGVAPRTVSYRLRRAEQLLGHPIATRRAELEVALRLHRRFS